MWIANQETEIMPTIARNAGSLVFPDKSNQNGDSDFQSPSEKSRQILTKNASNSDSITESSVVLSLPSTTVVSRQTSVKPSVGNGYHHQQKASSKKGGGGKKMSKKQKLLRKRAEAEMAKKLQKSPNFAEDDDELDQEDVKVKYSIVYFNWAVSDNEDSDNPDDENSENQKIKNITLPFRKLRLKQ